MPQKLYGDLNTKEMQAALYYARHKRIDRVVDQMKLFFVDTGNRSYLEVSPDVALLWE